MEINSRAEASSCLRKNHFLEKHKCKDMGLEEAGRPASSVGAIYLNINILILLFDGHMTMSILHTQHIQICNTEKRG